MSSLPVPAFTVTRLREGYDMSEVDEFVDELQRGLASRLPDPALADRILHVRFTPTRLRRGYDMSEVDEFLDVARAAAAGGSGSF